MNAIVWGLIFPTIISISSLDKALKEKYSALLYLVIAQKTQKYRCKNITLNLYYSAHNRTFSLTVSNPHLV